MGMALPRSHRTRLTPSYLDNGLALRLRRALRSPGELDAFWSETIAAGERSAEAIGGELQELRALLRQVDPLRALGALHMFDAFRRANLPGPANFGSDAMLELLATTICAEDETAVLERVEHEFEPQIIWAIDQALRRTANHMATVETGRALANRIDGASSPLLNMLRLENAFDRMAGFDPHVRRVVTAVFSRVDERARQTLGFALSDSLNFASLYGQVRLVHADRADLAMSKFEAPKSPANNDERVRLAAAHMTFWALHAAPPLEGGPLDEELAKQLNLGVDQFAALVEAMSTNLGSVDPNRILSDTSIRTRPLLRLSSGEWMWARPIDFVHGAIEWAFEACRTDQKLLQHFDTARQAVAENLVGDVLDEVFGREHVFRNVTYPDTQSDAESDTIISLPGIALLVETKGGRFSAAGRRAAPLRVDKHAKELVEAGVKQNQRTAKAIASNMPLTDKARRTVPLQPMDDLVPIVVTLDRVDPFSTFLGQPHDGSLQERNWVLSVTDLVMLADILPTPEEFVAYARMRLQMIRNHVTVFVEADCLGHWCEDRAAGVQEVSGPSGDRIRMVSDTALAMNDYFTQETINEIDPDASHGSPQTRKPSTGIPTQVLAALESERIRGCEQWPALVDSVARVAPNNWRPVERLLGALNRNGSRRPTRQLNKNIRRAQRGWTIDGQVVLTLLSPESGTLSLAIVASPDLELA